MSDNTKIEWTDATWNPITGCSVKSPGCKNCYAMNLAGTRMKSHPSRAGLTIMSAAGPVWNGEVRFNEKWLDQPLQWSRPRAIFVCAHSDLFHENVPDAWIDRVFEIMGRAHWHVFQVLTKRSQRMREYMERRVERGFAVYSHVWLGVSAEDQERARERIPDLLLTPAAVRWLSAEPLLGAIRVAPLMHPNGVTRLDWIVVGGESARPASRARPMNPQWARDLRDESAALGIPYLFKQWGEWVSVSEVAGEGPHHTFDDARTVRRVGKKLAGRMLDGVQHDGYPGACA